MPWSKVVAEATEHLWGKKSFIRIFNKVLWKLEGGGQKCAIY